jgi:transcriptional regulator with XRE-family HTH domain
MLNIDKIIERIEEVRNHHQLSAAAFASKIGVQRSAMSHILSGRNKPSLEFLMKIYEAFDEVALEWLIVGTHSTRPKKEEEDIFHTIDQSIEKPQSTLKEVSPEALWNVSPEIQNQTANHSEESVSPKEIIYLYENGSFERFIPKK